MKKKILLLIAALAVIFLVLGVFGVDSAATTTVDEPERVEVDCRVDKDYCRLDIDRQRQDLALGAEVAGLPSILPRLPQPTVRVTIRVPGPRVTIRPPRATIRVPGPERTIRETVRAPAPPARTVFRTSPPQTVFRTRPPETVQGPTVTERNQGPVITNNPRPGQTVTETAAPRAAPAAPPAPLIGPSQAPVLPDGTTESPPTGQSTTARDTLSPTEQPTRRPLRVTVPRLEFSVPETIGLSVLALLILAGIALAAMWAGYYLGYKDCDRNNAEFLSALRDNLSPKRKG